MITSDDIMDLAEPPPGFVPVPYRGGFIYVKPDYAKDEDGMYLPMDAHEAEAYVKARNTILPRSAMVTAIWHAADIKLKPYPLSDKNTGEPNFYRPGPQGMTAPRWFKVHDDIVKLQLDKAGAKPGDLIAGHKKDIIQGRRRGRVAIFGWHRLNGDPIQPVSNIHAASYKDYSHGTREVFPMWKNQDGEWANL
jgi:hypothetical protein